jgi:hypothetical protein
MVAKIEANLPAAFSPGFPDKDENAAALLLK